MNSNGSAAHSPRLHWLASLAQCAAAAAIVLAVSRNADLVFLAPYLIVMLTFSLLDRVLRGRHPNVLRELRQPSVPLADKLTFVGGGVLLTLHFLIGVADSAVYHWSVPTPPEMKVAGLLVMALGFAFASWAMVLNPYFSPIVRVQQERGHRVVTSGPYRVVRHPSYLGLSVGAVASAFALGSFWSLVPAALFVLLYARRATFEDDRLRGELQGYDEYARRVRYRVIPLVW